MRIRPNDINPGSVVDGPYELVVVDGVVELAPPSGVPTSRLISAGTGLTGGGDLSADRTLSIDTSAEAERIRDVIGAALVQGSNITITVNDAGDTITIAATSSASELLMADGVTAPPVPIETEAQDDWLYAD